MRQPAIRAALLSFVLALSSVFFSCGGPPGEEDLVKWAGSETGFQKLTQVIRDKDMPLETRVRALEVVVEKQQELRVRGMIELIADQADRATVARALADKLVKHIETKSAAQLPSKDAVLMLMRYLTPEQKDRAQQAIAAWAFADITWETPAADLKAKLESRISAGQIADLGSHGLEAAAILLANGFIAEQMVRYLSGSPAPDAKRLLVKAFRAFIPAFLNVNPFYLDAIRKTGDPTGAVLLFQLYQEQKLDQKSRDACFSVGAMMLDMPTIKRQAEAKPIIDELLKIGAAPGEDRWLAAANILTITGGAGFGPVLDLFKDDKSYGEPAATGNSIFDLCFELDTEGQPDASWPAIETALKSGNRVQKAMAILCAKTLGLGAAKPALSEVAALYGTKTDVSLADLLGDVEPAPGKKAPLTLGFLAKNALEGIAMLAASNLPGLDEKKRKARHFVIVVEYKELGEVYAKHVEERSPK